MQNKLGWIPKTYIEEDFKKTDVYISMLFNSTPHISKVLKKPSFYYDSYGFINKNVQGAQGIEVINGLNQLDSLLLKQINF